MYDEKRPDIFWVDFWWFRPQCFVYTYGLWWHCDMYKKKVVFRGTKSVSNCIRALPCCVVCFPTRFFFLNFSCMFLNPKKKFQFDPGIFSSFFPRSFLPVLNSLKNYGKNMENLPGSPKYDSKHWVYVKTIFITK